jgi:hypothetical protein
VLPLVSVFAFAGATPNLTLTLAVSVTSIILDVDDEFLV